MEATVRWRTTKGDVLPDVQLDIVLSKVAEVRVVGTRCHRLNVVLRRSDGSSDERVHTVGADDDPGTLLDRLHALRVATNADDRVVGDEQFINGEALSNVRAGLGRRVHEKRVEHRAAGTEASHSLIRVRNRAAQRKWTHIERHSPANGWHSCRGKALKEPPAAEDLGAMGPQDVCRNRVAWEGRLVNEQDLESAPCEQHGGWRAGTPRADDDGVVHREPPR